MTSPPDVQNVPDVWGLLEWALKRVLRYQSTISVQLGDDLPERIEAALLQRDRFVLVPKEPTQAMIDAGYEAAGTAPLVGKPIDYHQIKAAIAAAPKPKDKS